MPSVFQFVAELVIPYRRVLIGAALMMLIAVPISFFARVSDYGIYLIPGAMLLWGVIVVSVWFHPNSGFLSKGKPRWKRMVAWPGAICLDLWFLICAASFARVGPLSILP